MSDQIVDLNESVVLSASFTLGGVKTNPNAGTMKFVVKSPSGVVTTYVHGVAPAITNPTAGEFEMALMADDASGPWFYRGEGTFPRGTGTVTLVEEKAFAVRASRVL